MYPWIPYGSMPATAIIPATLVSAPVALAIVAVAIIACCGLLWRLNQLGARPDLGPTPIPSPDDYRKAA